MKANIILNSKATTTWFKTVKATTKSWFNIAGRVISFTASYLFDHFCMAMESKVTFNGEYSKAATYIWRTICASPVIVTAFYLLYQFAIFWQAMVNYINYVRWGI